MVEKSFDRSGREEFKGNNQDDLDKEIIKACRNGDVKAFKTIVHQYEKLMLNTAFRMIGNKQDAEDAVQNAFLSAFEKLHTFKGDSKFSTWLMRIVINMSKNQRRKQNTLLNKNTMSMEDCCSNFEFQSSINSPSPQQSMERKQIQQRVQWCINRIDEKFRDVLVLKDIQGYPYIEICEVLEIPKGTVKSKLNRARGNLKKCLKNIFGDLNYVLS